MKSALHTADTRGHAEHGRADGNMKSFRPLSDLVEAFTPFDETEAEYVQQLKHFLSKNDNPYDQSNLKAHIVADAWIVNPSRSHVVLVEHPIGRMWMAPGGHCDGNPDVFATAVRETEEETGLIDLKPLGGGEIIDVNMGTVPAKDKEWGHEPAHTHFDICFAFEAPDNAPLHISHESDNLAWVALDTISQINYQPLHLRRVEKTLAGLLHKI